MEIVKLDQTNEKAWDKFCFESEYHWFWSTVAWITYQIHSTFGVEYTNHSFFIGNDIVPLIQVDDELVSPGFEDKKEIIQAIKQIALENGIKRISTNGHVRGYLDCSKYTCILDLDNIKPTKGHRSAIAKAEKRLNCTPSFNTNKFRNDYYRIAGKKTRPEITFDLMYKWIELGMGTLLEARLWRETVGFAYILHWKDRAYYFASCVEPEHRDCNVTHYMLWRAFEILRDKGIKYIELGEQVYDTLHCQPTDKEKNISKFKKGFGGQIVLAPASEFYFDREYFEQVYSERIKKYKERL